MSSILLLPYSEKIQRESKKERKVGRNRSLSYFKKNGLEYVESFTVEIKNKIKQFYKKKN